MDFSENYTLQPQDEIVASYFVQKQITLCLVFIIPHAENSTIENPVILKESLIIIFYYLTHNASSVYVFTSQLLTHLRSNPGLCNIEILHRWSDNCAVQYKCLEAFSYLSKLGREILSESGHGKVPRDCLGATTKRKLDSIIMRGKVINTAYEA